jgi:deazaflavin-dependent oxidoreductase (nitroreductase family)
MRMPAHAECARHGASIAGPPTVNDQPRAYERPSRLELVFNRIVGTLLRLGIGFSHMRILEVRGRNTGKLYRVPVDVLSEHGKLYLVAPRGHTQWVRNADASGQVSLRRGARVERYRLRALADAEKPPILKAYLDRFRRAVQRYFAVPAGSPAERFGPIAFRYPVYELVPATSRSNDHA